MARGLAVLAAALLVWNACVVAGHAAHASGCGNGETTLSSACTHGAPGATHDCAGCPVCQLSSVASCAAPPSVVGQFVAAPRTTERITERRSLTPRTRDGALAAPRAPPVGS